MYLGTAIISTSTRSGARHGLFKCAFELWSLAYTSALRASGADILLRVPARRIVIGLRCSIGLLLRRCLHSRLPLRS